MILKLNKDGIIQQFNIVCYPIDFVVVIGNFEKEVNKYYEPYAEEYKNAVIKIPTSTGCTYRIRERKTGIPCIMIWVPNKEEFTTSIVSHECCHSALEIWNYIKSEVSLSNQEPFCYLLGNLVRLAVGCFYEIPGIKPPVIEKESFENGKTKKKTSKKKKDEQGKL